MSRPDRWHIGTHKEASQAGTTNLPVWGADGQAICWVEDRGGEMRDNARRISAAPEMQEALRALVAFVEATDNTIPSLALARAAIAKATGAIL